MSDEPTRDANMSNRASLIEKYDRIMEGIEEERKGLNERAKEIREELKEASLNTKAIDDHRRLLKVAKKKSPEAAQEYIEARNEAFKALPIGTQMNLLEGMESDGGSDDLDDLDNAA